MTTLFRRARSRAATVAELAAMITRGGRWWLLPMLAVLLLSGVVLAVVQVLQYAAPFVYTIF
ncbi:MAG: hypothetical protein H6744_17695 [Deltaproteobacteria bacterium]|nr:hypothetical protein [Deltaproteobacteria bacterium]